MTKGSIDLVVRKSPSYQHWDVAVCRHSHRRTELTPHPRLSWEEERLGYCAPQTLMLVLKVEAWYRWSVTVKIWWSSCSWNSRNEPVHLTHIFVHQFIHFDAPLLIHPLTVINKGRSIKICFSQFPQGCVVLSRSKSCNQLIIMW